MRFYLGTHMPHWLATAGVPLFVSRRRLEDRRRMPKACASWALDSGGFTELEKFGGWQMTADAYADLVLSIAERVGRMDWAAPQDWMCEPHMLRRTGLSVDEHQGRTVENFVALRERLGHLVIPVLQGWSLADYERCWDRYEGAGVNLGNEPTVGLGSVCRRQATSQIGRIVEAMHDRGASLHGFGVKSAGVRAYGHLLRSADSMAWSFAGRLRGPCPKGCANHLHYAVEWRERLIEERPVQMQWSMTV